MTRLNIYFLKKSVESKLKQVVYNFDLLSFNQDLIKYTFENKIGNKITESFTDDYSKELYEIITSYENN